MDPRGAPLQIEVGDFAEAPTHLVEEAVRRARSAEGRADVEMSIALLGDADMRAMNRRYLGKDQPTDVLAFTLGGERDTVGDVYIGVEQATRQADALGVPLAEELARLAIHGALHVLGHDHPDGQEREQSPMFRLQERLLGELLADAETR